MTGRFSPYAARPTVCRHCDQARARHGLHGRCPGEGGRAVEAPA